MTVDYRTPPLSQQISLLARSLPSGRVWNAKYDQGRILGRLVSALAREINRAIAIKSNFVIKELDPNETRQLILEWEDSAGIPDQCFDRSADLVERRRRVVQKLNNFGGVITKEDIVGVLADFGQVIQIVPGAESNAERLGFGSAPYTTNQLKQIKHTLAVRVESDAPTFPLPFPIEFSFELSGLLQCLIRRIIPANVNPQFFFNENLLAPFTNPPAVPTLTGVDIVPFVADTIAAQTIRQLTGIDVAPFVADAIVASATSSPDIATLSGLTDVGATAGGNGGTKALVAGSNRQMVYVQHLRGTATTNADTAAVSYGGQAMTPRVTSAAIGTGGNRVRTRIYTLNEVGLALASDANFTDDISDTTVRATAALYENVDQTTPLVDSDSATAASGANVAIPTLTTLDGGVVVGGSTANSFEQTTSASWTGANEAVDVDAVNAWFGAADADTDGSGVDLTVAFTGANSNGCAAAISLRKA